MSIRNLFAVLAAAFLALGVAAGGSFAQTDAQKALIDAAKAEGIVGEQADGYLGFRVQSSDSNLQGAVTVTNEARRRAYAASGAQTGVTADVAGARMFQGFLLPRIRSGEWYRNTAGEWVRKP